MTIGIFLQNYWPLITSFIGVGIAWWRISIKFAEKQVADDEKLKDLTNRVMKIEAISPDINTIKTDVAVMKNSLEFIKGSITQLSTGSIQIQK